MLQPCPAHHDLERIIGQWALQRLRVIPRRPHPNVPFFIGRQDRRHGLRMGDHRVRFRRQEAEDVMWSWERQRLKGPRQMDVHNRKTCTKLERVYVQPDAIPGPKTKAS